MSDTTTHEHHPTPRLYVEIALTLGVLTAMEVSTFVIDFAWGALPLLIVLMSIKFALVGGFFMHLKFDIRFYTRIVATGLFLAIGLYAIVLTTWLGVPGFFGN